MKNDGFRYSFKVIGSERKVVASVVAAALFTEANYTGAPRFSYEAGGWVIDREGTITTPETTIEQKDSLRTVLDALKTAGAVAEGNGTVTFTLVGHTGNSLRNILNLIWSKQGLIQKSLGRQGAILPESLVATINAVPIDTIEDFAKVVNDAIDSGTIAGDSDLDFDLANKTLSFSFSNASLDVDEVLAFVALCQKLSDQARQQKFSSTKQKEAENDRYAFRCFLLKLGFIGETFKTERKVLLARLSGNSSFRTEEARLVAEEKRKHRSSDANNLTLEQSKSEETENG